MIDWRDEVRIQFEKMQGATVTKARMCRVLGLNRFVLHYWWNGSRKMKASTAMAIEKRFNRWLDENGHYDLEFRANRFKLAAWFFE